MELEGLREGRGEGDPPSLTSVAFTKRVTFCAAGGHAGVSTVLARLVLVVSP